MARILVILAFVVILGVPFAARQFASRDGTGATARPAPGTPTLIIITPHIEQIRLEFAAAFDRWHKHKFGTGVFIDWRQPGGTTEIRKQLEAQAQAAVAAGQFDLHPALDLKAPSGEKLPEAVLRPGAIEADIFFGGGSYEHNQIKRGIEASVPIDGKPARVRVRLAAPPSPKPFDDATLHAYFGTENRIGVERLYDPDQYWFGAALSAFGLVYNRDLLREMGLPEPTAFSDLCDYRYVGMLAMCDPRQSGSVATLYDSILNREGWDRGWKILRELSANARAFAAASTQPPMDVGQGDAAAGVAIDFYGRGQAQALEKPGAGPNSSRMGYVNPPKATYVDADPVTILAGSRGPELARRFVEFVLSDEGQALWQFAPPTEPVGASNPPWPSDPSRKLGPERYRLRRMPVRHEMYTQYRSFLTDPDDPFEFASGSAVRGWRDAIGPLMGAFSIDCVRLCRRAWIALNQSRGNTIFPQDRLAEMERLFYALPDHPVFDASGNVTRTIPFTEANYKAISDDVNKWRDPVKAARAKIAYAEFFRKNYQRVIELSKVE